MFENLAGRKASFLDYDKYSKFAVVAPYRPDKKDFIFQVRSFDLNRQPGEISFPGGKMEAGETPEQAGVRETTEELLVPQKNIDIIAPLDVLITPFDSIVYPFVANLNDYDCTYSSDEVHEIFTVPFDFFLDNPPTVHYNKVDLTPSNKDFPYELLGVKSYPWRTTEHPVLFYQYEDKVIWGMTAQFINNLVDLYRKNGGG